MVWRLRSLAAVSRFSHSFISLSSSADVLLRAGFPNYTIVDADQFSVFIGEDSRLKDKLKKQYVQPAGGRKMIGRERGVCFLGCVFGVLSKFL